MKKAAIAFFALGLLLLVLGIFPLNKMREADSLSEKLCSEIVSAEAFLSEEHPVTENEAVLKMLAGDYSKPPVEDKYVFISPEGIVFHTKCDAWDEENLKLLYEELLLNRHGEEIYSLSEVVVYPQDDEYAAATHQQTTVSADFRLHLPCMPDWSIFNLKENSGVITLYSGEKYTTPQEMASFLSHEYGHHYTFYYIFSAKKESEYWNTEYAVLRGLTSENSFVSKRDYTKYVENHKDYLIEIAAEDYLVLMGSPNSRSISEYKDVVEQINGNESDKYITRNARPQENMLLPMAEDVAGLADYFYGFIGEKAPEMLTERDFNIRLARHSISYDLTIGHRTYVNYTVTWDKPFGDEAVYTLICRGEDDDEYRPVRTVSGSEKASATIGSVTRERGSSVRILDDNIAHGKQVFRVTAILPDGRICVSAPLTYGF
ncbi:MAG: hypothetical protein IJR90_05105 [Clostridia bacterium]|nr:hypothetical protein [Clostridia bacterium]